MGSVLSWCKSHGPEIQDVAEDVVAGVATGFAESGMDPEKIAAAVVQRLVAEGHLDNKLAAVATTAVQLALTDEKKSL